MIAYLERRAYATVNLDAAYNNAMDMGMGMLGGLVRDIDKLELLEVHHVYFHDYMADNIGVLGEIYDLAGIGLDDTARAAINQYLQDHPRGRSGKVQYDLEGQFGLKREDLYRDFAYYLDAFPVQREAENT